MTANAPENFGLPSCLLTLPPNLDKHERQRTPGSSESSAISTLPKISGPPRLLHDSGLKEVAPSFQSFVQTELQLLKASIISEVQASKVECLANVESIRKILEHHGNHYKNKEERRVPEEGDVALEESQSEIVGQSCSREEDIQSRLQELSQAPRVAKNDANDIASHIDVSDCSLGGGSELKPDDLVPDAEDESPGDLESSTLDVPDNPESLPPQKRRASLKEYYTTEGRPQTKSMKSIEFDVLEKFKLQRTMEGAEGTKVVDSIVQRIEAWLQIWNNIEIPKYDNRIYRFVNSKLFQPMCLLAIFLNSIFVAATEDWQIKHLGQDDPEVLDVLEISFTCFFIAELIVRLVAYRGYFFLNDEMLWNIFDFVLVAISVVDFIFEHVVGAQAGGNVTFMRMLRLLKLARVFRSLRTFQFFRALTVMLNSLKQAFTSLFWGLVLLMFVLYLFSLIYLQATIDYLRDGGVLDAGLSQLVDTRLSSLINVIVSLYMAVSGGQEWALYYDMMLTISPIYGFLFLLFTFFFFFALLNILTALVVEKAMMAAEPDRSDKILKRRREITHSRQELIKICRSIDRDKTGRISYEEFAEWCDKSVMRYLLESIGLDIRDVKLFFSTVGGHDSDGTGIQKGEVTIEHFVEGCLHMQGTATALDMQKQLYDTATLARNLRHLDSAVSHRLSCIEKVLTDCLPSTKSTVTAEANY